MAWIALAGAAVTAAGTAAGAPKMSSAGPLSTNPWGMFDNSAWTVATGQARASATNEKTAPMSASPMGAAASSLSSLAPWLIGGIVVVMVVKAWKK